MLKVDLSDDIVPFFLTIVTAIEATFAKVHTQNRKVAGREGKRLNDIGNTIIVKGFHFDGLQPHTKTLFGYAIIKDVVPVAHVLAERKAKVSYTIVGYGFHDLCRDVTVMDEKVSLIILTASY